jgi:hypothetical protein
MKSAPTQKLNQGKKSGNQIHQLAKNIVAQHQVERWEEEEGMETTLLKKKKNSIQDSGK